MRSRAVLQPRRSISAPGRPLDEFPIEIDTEAFLRGWSSTLALARAEEITAYDAAYLELALRRGLPLATKDQALARAASRRGVELLEA